MKGEDSDDTDDDEGNVAAITGAILGGLCLVGFITGIVVCFVCCKRTSRKTTVVENQVYMYINLNIEMCLRILYK